jgi:hypothetical protein
MSTEAPRMMTVIFDDRGLVATAGSGTPPEPELPALFRRLADGLEAPVVAPGEVDDVDEVGEWLANLGRYATEPPDLSEPPDFPSQSEPASRRRRRSVSTWFEASAFDCGCVVRSTFAGRRYELVGDVLVERRMVHFCEEHGG